MHAEEAAGLEAIEATALAVSKYDNHLRFIFIVHSAFTLSILFLTIFMFVFRLGLGADVFGTPTMRFTLPIYAHDMAMVLAAQLSPTKASTPSPRYDPRAIDLFELFAEVDNE
jgi:hypothetical protein